MLDRPIPTDGEGHALMSLHAWLVRHEGRVLLVDAGAGNNKPRPQQMVLDKLSTGFLTRQLGLQGLAVATAELAIEGYLRGGSVRLTSRTLADPDLGRASRLLAPRTFVW
jgi:hypothetical protein